MAHLGYGTTDDGIRTSIHKCGACEVEFTLCPAVAPDECGWEDCLQDDCVSYDPHRDMDILFMTVAEIADQKSIISISKLRERKEFLK